MKNKSRRKLTTILGLIPLLVLLFGIVGGVTYALMNGTKANTKHGFQVNVRGAVNVSANIVGKSYQNNTLKETLDIVSFDGTQEQELSKVQDFANKLSIDTKEDKVSYVFEITNTTAEEKYTDLIIEPTYTLTEADNVISTMYYAIPNSDYEVCTDKYLVAHKGNTILVKIEIGVTEIGAKADLEGSFELNLYTEDGLPVDFEYDKTYSVVDGKAYVTETCPTCGATHRENVAMEEGTYAIATPTTAQAVLDSDINGKVVIFSEDIYSGVNFNASTDSIESRKNVVFAGAGDVVFNGKFRLVDTTDSLFENIAIQDIKFVGKDGLVSASMYSTSIHGLTVKNCSFITTETCTKAEAYGALFVSCESRDVYNIRFENNYVEGHFHGVKTHGVEDIYVYNNEIKNTVHNAIGIQNLSTSGVTYKSSGDLFIKNNKIYNDADFNNEDTRERAIRINGAEDMTIVIEANEFTNFVSIKDGDELLKISDIVSVGIESSYSIVNNTYAGMDLNNIKGETFPLIIVV